MNNRMTWRWVLTAAVLLTATLGPATAGRAQQPNITYLYNANWDYPFMPTDAPHTPPEVRVPAVLPGNTTTIYMNFFAINDGSVAASTVSHGKFFLDGQDLGGYTVDSVNPGQWFGATDIGPPTSICGGRHTLEIQHDVYDEIAESDENDNDWAHQFIFSPLWLNDSTPVIRGAPPDRGGGWSSIVDGSTIDMNCDGFRFSSTGWWNVVTVRALDTSDDYDAFLYDPSTGSEDGFTGVLAFSAYLAGVLDAVAVNRNVTGIQDWDVGVENFSEGGSSFVIEKVISNSLSSGDAIGVSFVEGEFLKVWDTFIWSGDAGWLTVSVDGPAGGEPLTVALFDPTISFGGLDDAIAIGSSDEQGRVRLHHQFTGNLYYGLILYRSPLHGGFPLDVTLELKSTKPDVRPAYLAGWSAPLVPRPLPDGNPEWVAAPDTLFGYVPETWFNVAFENFSPVLADPVTAQWYRDGQDFYVWGLGPVTMLPYGVTSYNSTLADEIPGGRHTLTLHVEPNDLLDEVFEDNNYFGEQFCWSPKEIASGNLHEQIYPPLYSGGFWSVTTEELLFYNCDGYRLLEGSGWWQAMALNQGPSDDYDIQLYEPLVGVKGGFTDPLAGSYWLAEQSDYVLVNHNVVGGGAFDVGILNTQQSGFPYTVEAVTSQILPVGSGGNFGPYLMEEFRMLHLWDIWLEPGPFSFRLYNDAGTVNWGMGLHPAAMPFQGRSDVLPDGMAWLNGPGEDEWINVVIPDAGWYCLAIYKATPYQFGQPGEYRLQAGEGPIGVASEDEVPAATALAGVFPNPFNPRTTIAFDLSAAGPVELAVYDLQGACVRRLVQAELPPGRHEAVWDGTDEAGRRVASGCYMSRLEAGGKVGLKKMVMLK